VEKVNKEIVNKLTSTQQLIIFIVTLVSIAGGYFWDKVDSKKALDQSRVVLEQYVEQGQTLRKIVDRQEDLDLFKTCVNTAVKEAVQEFNDELIIVLGETLRDTGISFPQELNKSITRFRGKLGDIKDCLIDPKIK
jgi:hypothetical protein